jgi:hypothetical protein
VTRPAVAGDDDTDRLRRSGISINREGHFIHEGMPVEHEGLRRALFRWLDRLPDGRHVFRLDAARFVFVEVDDTPLVVRSARAYEHENEDASTFTLGLSDGTTEPLAPDSLTVDGEGVLRCSVRDRKFEARLSSSAIAVLADSLFEGPDGVLQLRMPGQLIAVPRR